MDNIGDEDIFQLMLDLTKVPSISTTQGEKELANIIYKKLSNLEYFKNNNHNLMRLPIEDDTYKRDVVIAIVKAIPDTSKTVILTGHYDVVSVEGFGNLKEYAFDPIKYTEMLSSVNIPREAKEDLESGNYLFGRGIMDMKCGLAIQMDFLAEVSKTPERLRENIMFLAVPDEENNSMGMREAIRYLSEFQEQMGLVYTVAINCEPSGFRTEEGSNRDVFLGTVGKIMPVFCFRGKESHGGEYFQGLNANLLAACVNILLEANPKFIGRNGREVFSPPGCLKYINYGDCYSVTIPEKAAAYYNIITTSMSPAEILEKMVKIAEKAFDMAIDHLKSAALSVSSLADSSPSIPWKTDVVTYKELYKAVCGCFSGNLEEYIKDHIEKLPSEMDDRDKCISLIDNLLELYPEKGPMIVVGFLPPYYPHRCSLRKSSCDERLIRVLDEIIDEAKTKYNEQIKVKEYFSGMCDLSYFGFQGEPNELMALSENMPGWGDIYSICIEELLKLDIPILNLGPSGKDAHKYTERLELNYSLNIVPQMLRSLISKLTDSIF